MPRIHITPVVLNLLIINALVFLVLNLFPEQVITYFELFKLDWIFSRPNYILPSGQPVGFHPVQIVTSFFAHQEFPHFIMNMLGLVFLGPMLEMVMKPKRFLTAYLTIGVLSSFLIALFDPSPIPTIGASGVLFGLTVLYAYYFPHAKMGLLFIPVSFKINYFVIGAAAISLALVIAQLIFEQSMGGISHFGHLMGIVVGFLYYNFGKLIIATKPKR